MANQTTSNEILVHNTGASGSKVPYGNPGEVIRHKPKPQPNQEKK